MHLAREKRKPGGRKVTRAVFYLFVLFLTGKIRLNTRVAASSMLSSEQEQQVFPPSPARSAILDLEEETNKDACEDSSSVMSSSPIHKENKLQITAEDDKTCKKETTQNQDDKKQSEEAKIVVNTRAAHNLDEEAKSALLHALIREDQRVQHWGRAACASPIYCNDILLALVQLSGLFSDGKQFVDMPTKKPVVEVLAALKALLDEFPPPPPKACLESLDEFEKKTDSAPPSILSVVPTNRIFDFLMENFHPVGYDLQVEIPADWTPRPPFLPSKSDDFSTDDKQGTTTEHGVTIDPALESLAMSIHEKWKALTRSFSPSRVCSECASSSLAYLLKHPFVIPGGRFREFYYWDTFWIGEGLWASGMGKTVEGMLKDIASVIQSIGYFPNGTRVYYTGRSQPPLFTRMLSRWWNERSKGTVEPETVSLLQTFLEAADKEYTWWMRERSVKIEHQGQLHVMNIYGASSSCPRPESYAEDLEHGKLLGEDEAARSALYHEIAAAAESGWDFSDRWCFRQQLPKEEKSDSGSITDTGEEGSFIQTATTQFVPSDLNALMCSNERQLAALHRHLAAALSKQQNQHVDEAVVQEHFRSAESYEGSAEARVRSIHALLWLPNQLRWCDWDLRVGAPCASRGLYVSDLGPLLYSAYDPLALEQTLPLRRKEGSGLGEDGKQQSVSVERLIIQQHKPLLEDQPGGVPVSLKATGHQWDFPNVWAPIIYDLLEAYKRLEQNATSAEDARFWLDAQVSLARRWLHSVYCAWKLFGHFLEKVHAGIPGWPGGGGEYTVQEGFGWTNGVTLCVIQQYWQHFPPGYFAKLECTAVGSSSGSDKDVVPRPLPSPAIGPRRPSQVRLMRPSVYRP